MYALKHPEPVLISQNKGAGRLVGMSLETGLGLKAGDVGLLMFEDKVSAHDSSHAVRIKFTFAKDATGLGKRVGLFEGVPETQKTFTFKGEESPLSMLKDAFVPHLPAPTQLPTVQASGVTVQGCQCFLQAQTYIRQAPAPMAIYPLRAVLGSTFHLCVALVLTFGAVPEPLSVTKTSNVAVPLALAAAW